MDGFINREPTKLPCVLMQLHMCTHTDTRLTTTFIFLVMRVAWEHFEFSVKYIGTSQSFPPPLPMSMLLQSLGVGMMYSGWYVYFLVQHG